MTMFWSEVFPGNLFGSGASSSMLQLQTFFMNSHLLWLRHLRIPVASSLTCGLILSIILVLRYPVPYLPLRHHLHPVQPVLQPVQPGQLIAGFTETRGGNDMQLISQIILEARRRSKCM